MAALYDGDGNRLFTMDYTGENNDRWDIWIPECGGNADSVDDSAKDAMKELAGLVSWRDRRDYTITEYVNDVTKENEEVLAELNPRGKVTTAYTYGYNRESADVYGDTQYYLYDGQGNVSRISSEWGRVKETYNYDPYGNLTYGIPDNVNYYGFNGESSNLATGLQYLRARYYNPQNGNFITEDTYAGQISNPLTLNRYDYVSNNPVNYIDPSGHFGVFEQLGKDIGNFMKDPGTAIMEGLGAAWDGITSFGNKWNAYQQNQQYEHQLVAELVTGNLTKPGKTDKIASGTVEKLTDDKGTDTDSTKAEDKSNPLLEKVNQIAAVNEQQRQAELEIHQAYCDGLAELDKDGAIAAGIGVIAATGVATFLTGGGTTPQLISSIVGGLVGAIVHYIFADGDKEAAAAEGFMWGTITGVTLSTIGTTVGLLAELIPAIGIPAVAFALEGFLETTVEEFIYMQQGGTVSLAVFLTDWGWNSFTNGTNEPMRKLREWFKGKVGEGDSLFKKLLKFGDDHIPSPAEKETVEEILEGGSNFRNQDLLDSHYNKHGNEFGNITKEQYLQGANDLINSTSDDILTKTRANGDIIYYNPLTNEFAVKSADGYIRTYFKPSDGLDYFNRQ